MLVSFGQQDPELHCFPRYIRRIEVEFAGPAVLQVNCVGFGANGQGMNMRWQEHSLRGMSSCERRSI